MPKKNLAFDNAILKLAYGETLCEGRATVNVKEKTVTFESSFVPLYPIGTDMEIVRVLDKQEVHRFCGKVYLSDKTLMRIVSVSDELLPGSEEVYCTDMNFMAVASSCFSVEINKRGLFKPRTVEKVVEKEFDISIMSMTREGICFSLEALRSSDATSGKAVDYLDLKAQLYGLPIKEGHGFLITSTSILPFKNISVEVVKILPSSITPSFECRFVELTEEVRANIDNFLWQYNIIFNKLFD